MICDIMTNDRFREALRVQLTDERNRPIFKTIKELKVIMREKEFHVKWHKELKQPMPVDPTEKQLNYAYKYLKGYSQVPLTDYLNRELRISTLGKRYYQYRDPVTGRYAKKGV